MHFSSPSGCLLSTCRPWKRGGTGRTYSGYSSVVRSREAKALNVTPNPLMGSRKLLTGRLLQRPRGRRHDEVERRDREASVGRRDDVERDVLLRLLLVL